MSGLSAISRERVGECSAVALGNEQAVASGVHRFRNAAMQRGHDGKAAGHGFQHRIGNAFLIAGLRCLTGMQKEVGRAVGGREFLLAKKTRVADRTLQPRDAAQDP